MSRNDLVEVSSHCDAVAKEFTERIKAETGKDIAINYAWLIWGAKGIKSRAEENASCGWLNDGEVDVVIDYIIELGNCGFPLSHQRLKEHVDEILQAWLGDQFPTGGVGAQWTHRFVQKHSDQIKMSWFTPLELKWGWAVNEHTVKAFTLLQDTVTKYNIEELTYGTDKMGCNPAEGQKERVMGGKKAGPQYQQHDGDWQNIRVIVTICADGSSTPPDVIYKGKGFQVKWKQDNPANASWVLKASTASKTNTFWCRLGYSKKGWTTTAVALTWLQEFNKNMSAKADGRYRLLLVDGHNSHYSWAFLEYACTHQILVLCYPPHITHVLQGLDVVIFATMKLYLSNERDKWDERLGRRSVRQTSWQYTVVHTFVHSCPRMSKLHFERPGYGHLTPMSSLPRWWHPARRLLVMVTFL